MQPRLPILRTAFESWRFMAANTGAVLRAGWLPVAGLYWLATLAEETREDFRISSVLTVLVIGLATLVLLIVTLVAWQRLALFGPDHRKGPTPLRLGRAEWISIVHFPLFLVLLMPMLIVPVLGWIANGSRIDGGGLAAWLPYIAFGVLVFPGGPLLNRAALMLTAFAAAGRRRLSVTATANRVWTLSSGNTVRMFAALLTAALPVALLSKAADSIDRTDWHGAFTIAADILHVVLLVVYIMAVAGTLARTFETLGGMEKKKGKPQRKSAR